METSHSRKTSNTGPDAIDHYYSPKKVASAIGVSESSLKRWCDAGHLKAFKTAGGHRRVTRAEVISFLKRKNIQLKNPESIGLPDIHSVSLAGVEAAYDQILEALKQADELTVRKILISLFIQGRNMAEIFDRVISPAFEEIGRLWASDQLEVYQERLASQIVYAGLLDLQSLLPRLERSAPVAIGAALEGDQYQLATKGVELCLRNFGWNALSLGANIPIFSLQQAVRDREASLVWISISHVASSAELLRDVTDFCNRMPSSKKLLVGGTAVTPGTFAQLPQVHHCHNFAQLIMSVKTYPA